FGSLRHIRLSVKCDTVNIQTKCKPCCGGAIGVLTKRVAIFYLSYGMQVGNEQERFVALLTGKFNGRNDCAENISKMRSSGTLNACKYFGHGLNRFQQS